MSRLFSLRRALVTRRNLHFVSVVYARILLQLRALFAPVSVVRDARCVYLGELVAQITACSCAPYTSIGALLASLPASQSRSSLRPKLCRFYRLCACAFAPLHPRAPLLSLSARLLCSSIWSDPPSAVHVSALLFSVLFSSLLCLNSSRHLVSALDSATHLFLTTSKQNISGIAFRLYIYN